MRLIKSEYDVMQKKVDELIALKDSLDKATIDIGVANLYMHYIVGQNNDYSLNSVTWPHDVANLAWALEYIVIDDGCIDVFDPQYHKKPIWCVASHQNEAVLSCIRVTREKLMGLTVSAYRVNNKTPTFRYTSSRLDRFLGQSRGRDLRFYNDIEKALEKAREITTPEPPTKK